MTTPKTSQPTPEYIPELNIDSSEDEIENVLKANGHPGMYPYPEWIKIALETAKQIGPVVFYPNSDNPIPAEQWWIAWVSARRTASWMLSAARMAGFTPEQVEYLRKVASIIATD